MDAALRPTVESLAVLDKRHTAAAHLRRAYEVVRDQGPLEEVEGRMLTYLEARREAAMEREAHDILVRAFRRRGLPSEELMAPARARIAREGGISHEHAVALGYAKVADLTGQS